MKAFLLESPEKYDIREMEIVIPPYFLLSKGAIWLYMLIVAAIGLWLMFWQQKRLRRKYATKFEADADNADSTQAAADTNDKESQSKKHEEEQHDDYEIIEDYEIMDEEQ